MAGFRTHITTSTVLGVGYAGLGAWFLRDAGGEVPLASCMIAGGLCSLGGMLPDVDSDSGIPLREVIAFTAAAAPLMMLDRFARLGLDHESMVLAGALTYALFRFGLGAVLRKVTVHRGMFHSLPAALVAGLFAFLICSCDDIRLRYFKAGAIMLGYMSHLLLDELYSLEWHRGRLRLKKSFGTAVKLWGDNRLANFAVYAHVVLLAALAFNDPVWMARLEPHRHDLEHIRHTAVEKIETLLR